MIDDLTPKTNKELKKHFENNNYRVVSHHHKRKYGIQFRLCLPDIEYSEKYDKYLQLQAHLLHVCLLTNRKIRQINLTDKSIYVIFYPMA